MGVGIAYPTKLYEPADGDGATVTRVSDAKSWPRPPSEPAPGMLARLASYLASFVVAPPARSPRNVWTTAAYRDNLLVHLRLRVRESGQVVSVGTYHMPCAFRDPPVGRETVAQLSSRLQSPLMPPLFQHHSLISTYQVMTMHAALVCQKFLALSKGGPCVLAGDFNIKPHTPFYNLIVNGRFADDEPDEEAARAYIRE